MSEGMCSRTEYCGRLRNAVLSGFGGGGRALESRGGSGRDSLSGCCRDVEMLRWFCRSACVVEGFSVGKNILWFRNRLFGMIE